MKRNHLILIVSAIIIIAINQTAQAQTTVNLTKLFQDKFTRVQNSDPRVPSETYQDVKVRYESPTTLLINGDLITEDRIFNSFLWQSMDLLKNQYGFKLQKVMTSGVGSIGNPTTVYILITK